MIGADDVRRVAAGLPGASERMSYGMPGFRVADRLFARIRDEGDVLLVWCAGLEEKQELIAAEPAKFFTTPHYDGHPTVLVRFSAIDVAELTELMTESWRLRAPRHLVAAFDARQIPPRSADG
jgi:hypothetical protein